MSLRVTGLQAQVNVDSNEISHFSYGLFHYKIEPNMLYMAPDKLENGAQYTMKWRPIGKKMVTNVVSESLIRPYLYLIFFVKAGCILLVSFTLSHFHKSSPTLLQVLEPHGWRYVECVNHHKRDVHEEQHSHICGANKQ